MEDTLRKILLASDLQEKSRQIDALSNQVKELSASLDASVKRLDASNSSLKDMTKDRDQLVALLPNRIRKRLYNRF